MKQLQFLSGGWPMFLDDIGVIQHIALESHSVFADSLSRYSKVGIVSGAGISSTGSSTYTVQDGFVLYLGKILPFKGGAFSSAPNEKHYFHLVEMDSADPNSTRVHDNGVTFQAHREVFVELKNTATGVAEVDAVYWSAEDGERYLWRYEDLLWGKKTLLQEFIAPTGWTSLFHSFPAYVHKDSKGFVRIEGWIDGTNAQFTNAVFLPAEYRPSDSFFGVFLHDEGSEIVEVQTNGTIKINNGEGKKGNLYLTYQVT